MVNEDQLPFMLKLLDDKEPAIQEALREEFSDTSGDLSNEIAALAIDLKPADHQRLSELLLPGRRETLVHEWRVPQGGADALDEDWDSFEDLLRLISDYLHDGVTLRPALPDLLDMLAEDATAAKADRSENKLRFWMFESGKFVGNKDDYYTPKNSDLSWCMDTGLGNPISLALLFMLVARRLDLEVSGCNYPGHFLARIHLDGKPMLVDCFHRGRLISVEEILNENKNISPYAKQAILSQAPLGHIMLRILRNLEHSFNKLKQDEDAKIFKLIFESMQP
ncbi:transglutaminase-like domain-containing protein [Rubritalea tangerina]|uniref:Transglutaminase-like domain-containing protein n=1 Tax=Rubritalea tangerina TaxID=430798 RepID=A0ABW4ZCN9_9BACT